MKLIKLLLLSCVLTACDGSNSGVPSQGGAPGSLVHSVASGMAGGFGAGVGATIAHRATNHLVDIWGKRTRINRFKRF